MVLMTLDDRSRSLLSLLDYFKQASTSQIRRLIFSDTSSRTPCDRALARLTRDGYVRQIEKVRPKGGARGGSGEYVWSLGPRGWKLCSREARYSRQGAVDYHALTITEVYANVRMAERSGGLRLISFTPEPESWMTVRSDELKPDLLIEMQRPNGARIAMWIECDMGTQRPARIREKLDRYVRARDGLSSEQVASLGGYVPLVVFVCHDEERRTELRGIIEKMGDDARDMFRAGLVADFPSGLS